MQGEIKDSVKTAANISAQAIVCKLLNEKPMAVENVQL